MRVKFRFRVAHSAKIAIDARDNVACKLQDERALDDRVDCAGIFLALSDTANAPPRDIRFILVV